MPYAVKPLPFKPATLSGLSERLLVSHYVNNYGGALRRANAIEAERAARDAGASPVWHLNGLGREALVAHNSLILHEIYFDGLGGSGDPGGELAAALERDFGSVDAWRREFVAAAKALAGGSGWMLLAWSERLGRLVNQWAADHTHCLAGARVLLALDMYEHAYHLDFGADAGRYVDAFMRNVAWDRVAARLRPGAAEPAPDTASVAPREVPVAALQAMIARGEATVLDVRKREDLARAADRLPGALVTPLDALEEWVDAVPREKPIVTYCVYGFHVCREAAAELSRRGCDASVLAGGIAAWHASGGDVMPLDTDTRESLS